MSKLTLALQAVADQLSRFAGADSYWSLMGEVFGAGEGQPAAHAIETLLRNGDLGQLARLEVISAAQLGGAQAAYASANGTIYLSDRFLKDASQAELQATLLEEFGHAIDARVNGSDRPGDEGELFSLRVRGLSPGDSERQRILAEDDRRILVINGATLQVEQAAPVVYETTTIAGAGISASASSSYILSGINAAWTERSKAISLLKFFDGTRTRTIATSAYRSFGFRDVAISGATVAYTKSDGQDQEVYRFSGGITTRLTNNATQEDNLLMDGNTIVWRAFELDAPGGELYRNNGTTTTRITNNQVAEEDVQFSGNTLLWAASDGNDYEIYLNDGVSTRVLTNNTLEDYSPVLSGNRAAWFQWKDDQENLFFYNGVASSQVTTNLKVSDPVIAGGNLLYKQQLANGNFALRLYNGSSRTTSTLSSRLTNEDVQVSGNLVAWLENGGLRLYNGRSTATIATNVLDDSSSGSFGFLSTARTFYLRGTQLFYLGRPSDSSSTFEGELFRYDSAAGSSGSVQLTAGENISRFDLDGLEVSGDRILWNSGGDALRLTQPTTKPILSFAASRLTVVEGFTSPQNAILTVNLSAASSVPVTVAYETFTDFSEPNPAFEGSDYTETDGTLTFAPGVTTQVITIPILDNSFTESDKQFFVRLLAPSNAVLQPGGSNSASITITDTWQVTGAAGSTFTLPVGVENLTLTGTTDINGTGNASSNTIRGNSGNNRLAGGGGFGDELIGGLGNDTYVVRRDASSSTPTITEIPGQGVDTVEFSSIFSSDVYTLPDEDIENLVLTGSANSSGNGNALDNLISGNSGNNSLIGLDGRDTVSYAAAPGAVVVSLSNPFGGNFGSATGWGADTLTEFENIIGSAFADTLTGDDFANVLTGNAGKDVLTGRKGADKFDYRTLSHSPLSGFDRILDFNASPAGDRFLVSSARAGFLSGGQVTPLLTDAALTATAIGTQLTTANFLPSFAATVTMGSGPAGRTFVVINDAVAGFNALSDGVVEVTGFTGTFGASQFVTS